MLEKWQSEQKENRKQKKRYRGKSRFYKKSFFRLLNPKNLQREVHIYGYHFSWKNQLLVLVCALIGMAALSILFQLSHILTLCVLLLTILLLPVLILDTYKRMYEQKRFADVVTYIEQLMYSFQKSGKIKIALLECAEIFDAGEMKTAIDEAVSYINRGSARTEKGILREALTIIEEVYQSEKLHTAHELILHAEQDGGEIENSIVLILEDTENWKRRCYQLQAEKKQSHTDNIISILVATILCALCIYVIDYMRILFQSESVIYIFDNSLIQATSFFFILFSMLIFKKSSHNLTNDWVGNGRFYEDAAIRKMYYEVKEYDEKKEARKSRILALPLFVAIPLVYIYGKRWICIFLLIAAGFLLVQHKAGYKLAKQDVMKAMYIAFPEWLMEMALLLQNNNVQVSIIKSREHSPAVLEMELDKLIDRIGLEPDKLSSYTCFCRDFEIPEAQSCMKMLHAISESGTGDAKVQINNLLEHINRMQNQADNLVNENISFKMRMIFSYPVFAAAIKMLIDLTVGMFVLFQLMGNVGGY